jgi:hypothetical protein
MPVNATQTAHLGPDHRSSIVFPAIPKPDGGRG